MCNSKYFKNERLMSRKEYEEYQQWLDSEIKNFVDKNPNDINKAMKSNDAKYMYEVAFRAIWYDNGEHISEGIKLAKKIIDCDDPHYLYEAGALLSEIGRDEDALKLLNKAVSLNDADAKDFLKNFYSKNPKRFSL